EPTRAWRRPKTARRSTGAADRGSSLRLSCQSYQRLDSLCRAQIPRHCLKDFRVILSKAQTRVAVVARKPANETRLVVVIYDWRRRLFTNRAVRPARCYRGSVIARLQSVTAAPGIFLRGMVPFRMRHSVCHRPGAVL